MSRPLDQKIRNKIAALRDAGFSYWEIAKMLNIQPSLIAYYASDGNEKRKKRLEQQKQEKSKVAQNSPIIEAH